MLSGSSLVRLPILNELLSHLCSVSDDSWLLKGVR